MREYGPMGENGSAPLHSIIFTREDGSQVMVEAWSCGCWDMSERPDSSDVWGPPVSVEEDQ